MGIHGSPADPQIPPDTSSEAHRVQREIYMRMGGAGRLAIDFQLTETTRHLALAGIRRRHPAYTDMEMASAWPGSCWATNCAVQSGQIDRSWIHDA